MEKEEAKRRIDELTEQLDRWTYEYYVLDNPSVEDAVFDRAMAELMMLEDKFPEYRYKTSPSQRVGGAVLDSFAKKAELGQIIEVKEIKAAYEEKVGHSTGGSQIYYVLARHGWRKIMPRSRHPKKASDEAIDASKKLTESSEKK